MILACQNISKAFGTTEIIKNASFHIEEREKAALIGNNGAGKTTLLRIIMEEIHSDAGQSGGLLRAVQAPPAPQPAPRSGGALPAGRHQHEPVLRLPAGKK